MIKIRKLRDSDIDKIQKMIEYIYPGSTMINQLYEGKLTIAPLDFLHSLAPINLKFLQESYVAADEDTILGVIGLISDGRQKTRWKINRLVLNVNKYDIGKQLIDYVVNKYGGAGVETFITSIDENYGEAIALFKHGCGFRSCTKIHVWEKDDLESIEAPKALDILREANVYDAKNLQELEQQCIFPHFRPSLTRNVNDFKFDFRNKIISQLRGYKVKAYVLDNPIHKSGNQIEGYILIVTRDNKNFWADIILSLGYQTYYEDMLTHIIHYISEQNRAAKLHLYVRKYYQGSDKLDEVVHKYNFNQAQVFQVLVKDYWKVLPATDEKKSPIVIFPTSPACNIMKNSD